MAPTFVSIIDALVFDEVHEHTVNEWRGRTHQRHSDYALGNWYHGCMLRSLEVAPHISDCVIPHMQHLGEFCIRVLFKGMHWFLGNLGTEAQDLGIPTSSLIVIALMSQ